MTEKYCIVPIKTCEYVTNKADCENCPLNKRFIEKTIDNWESYIHDNKTGKEYGQDISIIIDLLNDLEEEKEFYKNNTSSLYDYKKNVSECISNYWKKQGTNYVSTTEVLELILKELDLELII